MIYNRFGDVLEIVTNCGSVHPRGFDAPVTLVKIRYTDNKQERWMLAEYLKADGGLGEIEHTVSALPVLVLSKKDLKTAMKQAR